MGRTTASAGRTVAFAEWGTPDGGPVFLLHGTPGSRLLRDVSGAYERQHARVITYDRPGYGRSDRRPGLRTGDAAEDVELIADQLGIGTFAVLGISGGGPYALGVAARLGARVTRCATIVGVADYAADDLDFFAGMGEDAVREWQDAERGERWIQVPDFGSLDFPQLPPAAADMLTGALRESMTSGPYGFVDDYLALVAGWDFDLGRISAPVRVLAGREDETVPPQHARWIAAHVPDAELIWADGGHIADRSEPEEQLIGWLSPSPRPS